MMITPQEIQNKEFREAFRGYNQDDVDTFLDDVAEAYGHAYGENQRLRIQLATIQQEAAQRGVSLPASAPAEPLMTGALAAPTPASASKTERAEAREEMKRALVATQRAAEAALEEAKRRAAEIVMRAEQRAKEIDELTARRAKDIDGDASSALTYAQQRVEELRKQETEIRGRLRRLLAEHVKMLQQLEGEPAGSTPMRTSIQTAPTPEPVVPPVVAPATDSGTQPPKASAPQRDRKPLGIGAKAQKAANGLPAADASKRAAVVERMTRELGEAAQTPSHRTPLQPRDSFWKS